ncbi:MAG: hypothetical protein MASP_00934 [Candidatus Methanolliviera sp. GoM_asphalt]|nr:MAG: hypothetical protein MASP_00934 [Candidatus Methanolliviera sp. GoM_asphalt]
MSKIERPKETYARVLDYLPYGYLSDHRPVYQKKPIIQSIGEEYFVLLELVPKKGKIFNPYDKAYIGEGERDNIDHIKRRISYDDLTNSSQMELIGVIEEIVKEKEQEFVEFFNKSDSITSRFHHLEIIPGIGKKLMWDIIDERRRSPLKSFDDIEKRIKTLYHPKKLIAKRIEEEIKDKNIKYRTFSKGPSDGLLKRI